MFKGYKGMELLDALLAAIIVVLAAVVALAVVKTSKGWLLKLETMML